MYLKTPTAAYEIIFISSKTLQQIHSSCNFLCQKAHMYNEFVVIELLNYSVLIIIEKLHMVTCNFVL